MSSPSYDNEKKDPSDLLEGSEDGIATAVQDQELGAGAAFKSNGILGKVRKNAISSRRKFLLMTSGIVRVDVRCGRS